MASSEMAVRLQNEIVAAMKAKAKDRLGVLRMMQAAVKQMEVDERRDLSDQDVLKALAAYAKKVKDQVKSFQDGGRSDLLAAAEAELAIVNEFLPAEMSDEELAGIVDSTIEETGASGPADMGRVMKAIMPKTAGVADGSRVSAMVKKKLGG